MERRESLQVISLLNETTSIFQAKSFGRDRVFEF